MVTQNCSRTGLRIIEEQTHRPSLGTHSMAASCKAATCRRRCRTSRYLSPLHRCLKNVARSMLSRIANFDDADPLLTDPNVGLSVDSTGQSNPTRLRCNYLTRHQVDYCRAQVPALARLGPRHHCSRTEWWTCAWLVRWLPDAGSHGKRPKARRTEKLAQLKAWAYSTFRQSCDAVKRWLRSQGKTH